jgi:HPt (histidine-containing phosphotransfer) domain-containing protein
MVDFDDGNEPQNAPAADDSVNKTISETLDRMWAKYLPDVRQRAEVLAAAATEAAGGALSQALRADARSAAHKLAGTLGTFGLPRGTELARELELLYASNDSIATAKARRLATLADEIKVLIEGRK